MPQENTSKNTSIPILILVLILIAILLNVLVLGLFKNVISEYNEKSYKLSRFERGLNAFKREVEDTFNNEVLRLNLLLDVASLNMDTQKSTRKKIIDFPSYKIIADTPSLKPLFKEISSHIEEIFIIEDDIIKWCVNYSPVAEDITQNKSLNKVRAVIEGFNNSLSAYEGKERLKRSKELRLIKNAGKEESAVLSRRYINEFLLEQPVDFNLLKYEINDLSLFIERLNSETNLYDLPDLKDNKIKQSLERIQKILLLKDKLGADFILPDHLVHELSGLIFGINDPSYLQDQQVVLGNGGYFSLRHDYLLLLKEHERLNRSLHQIGLDINQALLKFNETVFVLRQSVVDDQKMLFLNTWKKVLGVSLIFLSIFIVISFYIMHLVRKQIAREQKTRDEINALIEGTGDALRVIDTNFNVLRVNSKMAELTGVSAIDSIGRKCFDLFPGGFCNTDNCPVKLVCKKGVVVQNEDFKIDRYGQSRPFDVITAPLKENGKTVSIIESYRDVSDYVKLQHEIELKNKSLVENQDVLNKTLSDLQQSHQELKEAQEQLIRSEKMASIGMLSAGVAHEINNPISFVLGNLEVLTDNVNTLLKTIHHIEDLIKNYLDMKSGAGQDLFDAYKKIVNTEEIKFLIDDLPKLVSQSVDGARRVQRIVKNLKDFAHPGISNKHSINVNDEIDKSLLLINNEIKYNCEVVKNLSPVPHVYANAQQLDQVFINLIVNASQAIVTRGIIRISTYQKDSFVVIEISDNGCGIATDDINKVFNPFYTTKEVGKGTGLGLAIVYGIVEDHGGNITLESKLNEGTTFRVFLPAMK